MNRIICPHCGSEEASLQVGYVNDEDAYEEYTCMDCVAIYHFTGRVKVTWDTKATLDYTPDENKEQERHE